MSDVCWLRLDFEDYTTAGPSLTDETSGGVCVDSFTVTVTFKILSMYLVVFGDRECMLEYILDTNHFIDVSKPST